MVLFSRSKKQMLCDVFFGFSSVVFVFAYVSKIPTLDLFYGSVIWKAR